MPAETFSFSKLDKLQEGRLVTALDLAHRRMIADLHDRPLVAAARKITLTVAYKPVTDKETGELCDADVVFEFKESVPKRAGNTYRMAYDEADAALLFHPDSPSNPHQHTIGDELERLRAEREGGEQRADDDVDG